MAAFSKAPARVDPPVGKFSQVGGHRPQNTDFDEKPIQISLGGIGMRHQIAKAPGQGPKDKVHSQFRRPSEVIPQGRPTFGQVFFGEPLGTDLQTFRRQEPLTSVLTYTNVRDTELSGLQAQLGGGPVNPEPVDEAEAAVFNAGINRIGLSTGATRSQGSRPGGDIDLGSDLGPQLAKTPHA